MSKRLYAAPDRQHEVFRQIGLNKFFAIRRSGGNRDSARIDDCRAATEPQILIFADTVRRDYITLIFDRARQGKRSKMFKTRKGPGGRDNESVDVLLHDQFSVHLGKPKIVADTETKTQAAQSKARECIARGKALLFFNRRDCIKVRLSIFLRDLPLLVDKYERIVNGSFNLLRYAAHNGNGKLRGYFLKSRNETVGPRIGVDLDYGHGVAGISHFRKNDELRAGSSGSAREITNLEKVRLWITERTRNLSGRNLHVILRA